MPRNKPTLSNILREGIGYSHREKVIPVNDFRMRTDERTSMNPIGESVADMLGVAGDRIPFSS